MSEHECVDFCVEHYLEIEAVCPYCLEEGSDSWELLQGKGNESGKTTCWSCEKEFEYATDISYRGGGVESVFFTTYQIDDEEATV